MIRRPPISPLFPYTPLSRSSASLLINTASTSEISGQAPGSPTEPIRLTRQELCRRSIIYLTMAGDQAYHRSEEHTSELQSQSNLVCRLLLVKKKYDT